MASSALITHLSPSVGQSIVPVSLVMVVMVVAFVLLGRDRAQRLKKLLNLVATVRPSGEVESALVVKIACSHFSPMLDEHLN
mmetsp:Transcript_83230/g.166187  ORF Transcript_83230/g.166187 Transcript_83230/m.166187 type:complete len:82 (-) Transcript_83230:1634-1879(-)